MATIELYAHKINMMSGYIQDVTKSVTDYNTNLSSLMTSSQQINQSICNTDDIIGWVQASSQMQEEEIEAL